MVIEFSKHTWPGVCFQGVLILYKAGDTKQKVFENRKDMEHGGLTIRIISYPEVSCWSSLALRITHTVDITKVHQLRCKKKCQSVPKDLYYSTIPTLHQTFWFPPTAAGLRSGPRHGDPFCLATTPWRLRAHDEYAWRVPLRPPLPSRPDCAVVVSIAFRYGGGIFWWIEMCTGFVKKKRSQLFPKIWYSKS